MCSIYREKDDRLSETKEIVKSQFIDPIKTKWSKYVRQILY